MKTDTLSIIANQQKLGSVSYQSNRLSFRYAPSWQESPGAFPISVSMPLALNEHPHEIIEAYLWGLLPDNKTVLDHPVIHKLSETITQRASHIHSQYFSG